MTKKKLKDEFNIDDYDYELIEVSQLIPYQFNSKIHSEENIRGLMASINESGLLNPILVDENMVIVGGHGRAEACKRLGMRFIRARVLRHLSENGINKARIQDNRTASGEYDAGQLRLELEQIDLSDINLDAMNFKMEEFEKLIGDYSIIDTSAYTENLDADLDEQIRLAKKDIQLSDKKKVPLAQAFGFKAVSQEISRKIARFIATIQEDFDLPPEEALARFITELYPDNS